MEKPCTTCRYGQKQFIQRPRPDKYLYELHDVYAGIICTKYNGPFGRDCQDYQNWRVIQRAEKIQRKMEQKITINCVIGIDPGANGGIAIFIPGQNPKVAKMPKDITELRDFFAYYVENYKPIVFLEKLSVRPDDVMVQGDRAAMGKMYRIQKLMANFEHLKALAETAGIPYVLTHPMSWQTALKLRIRGQHEEKADRKRRYQEHAAKLYPGVKVTLWNADALLLMHFGRWVLVNNPKWVKEQLPEREYQKLF